MNKLTKSAFSKLSVAKTKAALDAEIVSNGKTLFYAMAKLPSGEITAADRTKLVDMVLKARNQHRGDATHVASAEQLVDTFFSADPVEPTDPIEPADPIQPTPVPSTAEVSRPYWLGEWSNPADVIRQAYTENPNKICLFVLYNIMGRDNGNYSAGGAKSVAEYIDWVLSIRNAIGSNKAIIILEPDALGLSPALTEPVREERFKTMQEAVNILRTVNTKVYVDSSIWSGAENGAAMLKRFTNLDGFSVNVSGYESMEICRTYGDAVAASTGLKYVIDTSRNGNGNPHPGKWCNVTDTKIGLAATFDTGLQQVAAYLWIKVPGESDGLGINDDGSNPRSDVPPAGTLWIDFRDAIYSGNWSAFKAKYNV